MESMTAPQSIPSPRGAHLEMVGAVLAGDGLERIAQIAGAHTRAPVAVVVPRLGTRVAEWSSYERYVAARLAGGRPPRPAEIAAEVPVVSGGQELVLEVTARGAAPAEDIGGGTYRLLFRVLASHPEEVRSFYEDTIAAAVRYDEQCATDLIATLESYLANNCNMNQTAQAIYAHRHTVAYRLERVRDLTGLDPMTSEGRERLGLGLKAYRIIAPRLPR
jgi:hypothetical protein